MSQLSFEACIKLLQSLNIKDYTMDDLLFISHHDSKFRLLLLKLEDDIIPNYLELSGFPLWYEIKILLNKAANWKEYKTISYSSSERVNPSELTEDINGNRLYLFGKSQEIYVCFERIENKWYLIGISEKFFELVMKKYRHNFE